ncbi:protein FANTASTIC FOUR 3-like [Senna tora]|uniref:Protein FANTASTIC FOUR 3-like n=1 Tax=Senna tora TaxID=362788 RepID=A0A835CC37_9FABA|nr:protein FANTASTIC FOUR 3-like [Senna tora]
MVDGGGVWFTIWKDGGLEMEAVVMKKDDSGQGTAATSCLESQLVESRTTIRLSLPFSKSLTPLPQPLDLTFKSTFRDSNSKTHYSEETSTKSDTVHDKGGWSFLQALSNGGPKESSEKESVYVHPLVKRSSLMLSEKSLQLCTENLGNETGTDNVDSIELLCSSSEYGGAGNSPTREQTRAGRQGLGGKKTKARNFPPPLTTMRGSESLRIRPHRENGRLVIEAVRVTSSPSCFKAERSHGRLRLHLLENRSTSFDYEEAESDTEEKAEDESERSDGDDGTEEEAEEEENDDVEAEAEEEEDGERVEKYERAKKCKEGDNELLNWEPVWVSATS